MSLLPASTLLSPQPEPAPDNEKVQVPGRGGGGSLCLAQKVLRCELDGEQCANCSLFAEQVAGAVRGAGPEKLPEPGDQVWGTSTGCLRLGSGG